MQLFFEPRSVVLIGTSRQTGPGAYNNLEMLLSYGYQGRIYLVHPKVPEILGHKTYPRVAELPEAPDLAVISLGRERVVAAVKECVKKGIKRLVVISQGFADADQRGKELQEQMVAIAREHGARIVGPNTMGILNPFASFSTAFIDVPRESRPEPLTMVAQSGAFQVSPTSLIVKMGKAIDVGNACDVDVVEVLEYLENDPQTRIIVLHLEGIKRGREFLQTASRVARQKPIIAFKTGRSAAGARAAMSHTGSMVGEDAVVDLAFARAGIIRARNLVELRAICRAFLHYRAMPGPRLGVVTATGAFGIIAADACEDYGLELAPFPESLRELEEERIAWHKLNNPVDLWPLGMVTGSFMGVFKRAAAGLLQADQVDAVLGVPPVFTSPRHADLDIVGTVRRLSAKNPAGKPLALLLYGEEAARQALAPVLEAIPDVACFDSMDEAVMGLAALQRYHKIRQPGVSPARFELPSPGAAARRPLPGGQVLVGEAALDLVKPYGIAAAPGALGSDVEAAATRAAAMGYPVVLKIISPEWLHKSDLGGVRLNIAGEPELRGAFQELTARFRQRTPAGTLTGLLVQKQLKGVELLLGLKQDPQFGPVLVAGAGGIYTEILRDVARALAPVSREEAGAMLAGLKIYPILKGVRGQPGVNLTALTDTILALSQLAMDYPEIQELDLNPVLATADGCWTVDCRVVV
jgi:acetate---CoA ligase (ADP-forming)